MNSNDGTRSKGRTWQLFIAIGVLWLLLAAALVRHRQRTPPQVEITGVTEWVHGTMGFSLFRGQTVTGGVSVVNEEGMIVSQGGPVAGASSDQRPC